MKFIVCLRQWGVAMQQHPPVQGFSRKIYGRGSWRQDLKCHEFRMDLDAYAAAAKDIQQMLRGPGCQWIALFEIEGEAPMAPEELQTLAHCLGAENVILKQDLQIATDRAEGLQSDLDKLSGITAGLEAEVERLGALAVNAAPDKEAPETLTPEYLGTRSYRQLLDLAKSIAAKRGVTAPKGNSSTDDLTKFLLG